MPVERRAPGAAQDSLHGPATTRESTRRAPSHRIQPIPVMLNRLVASQPT